MEEDLKMYNILMELDGLSKENAQELLRDIYFLLTAAKSPVNKRTINEVWFPEINKEKTRPVKRVLEVHGHVHTCIAHNNVISIYKRRNWYSNVFPNKCLYYTLAKDRSVDLRKFTNTHLLYDFRISVYEDALVNYLKHNSVYKKNKFTKTFEVLSVLDNSKKSIII